MSFTIDFVCKIFGFSKKHYLKINLAIPKNIVHLTSFLRQDKQKDHQQRIVAVVSLKSGSREPALGA
jgi:hypothetical protein